VLQRFVQSEDVVEVLCVVQDFLLYVVRWPSGCFLLSQIDIVVLVLAIPPVTGPTGICFYGISIPLFIT